MLINYQKNCHTQLSDLHKTDLLCNNKLSTLNELIPLFHKIQSSDSQQQSATDEEDGSLCVVHNALNTITAFTPAKIAYFEKLVCSNCEICMQIWGSFKNYLEQKNTVANNETIGACENCAEQTFLYQFIEHFVNCHTTEVCKPIINDYEQQSLFDSSLTKTTTTAIKDEKSDQYREDENENIMPPDSLIMSHKGFEYENIDKSNVCIAKKETENKIMNSDEIYNKFNCETINCKFSHDDCENFNTTALLTTLTSSPVVSGINTENNKNTKLNLSIIQQLTTSCNSPAQDEDTDDEKGDIIGKIDQRQDRPDLYINNHQTAKINKIKSEGATSLSTMTNAKKPKASLNLNRMASIVGVKKCSRQTRQNLLKTNTTKCDGICMTNVIAQQQRKQQQWDESSMKDQSFPHPAADAITKTQKLKRKKIFTPRLSLSSTATKTHNCSPVFKADLDKSTFNSSIKPLTQLTVLFNNTATTTSNTTCSSTPPVETSPISTKQNHEQLLPCHLGLSNGQRIKIKTKSSKHRPNSALHCCCGGLTTNSSVTCGFTIPPVFSHNCPLFDENSNLPGGFYYSNSSDNKIIMDAIVKARKKWHLNENKSFEEGDGGNSPSEHCTSSSNSTLNKFPLCSGKNRDLALINELSSKYLNQMNLDSDHDDIDSGRSSLVGFNMGNDVNYGCQKFSSSESNEEDNNGSNNCNEVHKRKYLKFNGRSITLDNTSLKSINSVLSEHIDECDDVFKPWVAPEDESGSEANAKHLLQSEANADNAENRTTSSYLYHEDPITHKNFYAKTVKNKLKVKSTFLRNVVSGRRRSKSHASLSHPFFDATKNDNEASCNGRKNKNLNEPSDKHYSTSCSATSSISMHWRKLIRTISAGSSNLKGEKPSAQSFGAVSAANLNREWEVVTVRELCRRLSLEDSLEPSEMPLPEGSLQSKILDEFMIRQIVDILPPRAEGYPWVNIYSSEKHGFSLATLYRKMSEWNEEMSPILLIIRDTNGHVFGAVTSTFLRPTDHYYGTGDSCLLFRMTGEFPHTRELRHYTWTGDNQFFINATREFLSMGGGSGHYGLWLDADLNHGRSQRCATFDNEPLASGSSSADSLDAGGDFVVQFVEAFGFSMS